MSRILAALLAVLIFNAAFGTAVAATTGIVHGTITLDDKPAAGARLTLTGEGSRFVTTTDARGAYSFEITRSSLTTTTPKTNRFRFRSRVIPSSRQTSPSRISSRLLPRARPRGRGRPGRRSR